MGEWELEKRRRELRHHPSMGPVFTVQGTVTRRETGSFVCCAVTPTFELIDFICEIFGVESLFNRRLI